MKNENPFKPYNYDELPWVYIGYCAAILKNDKIECGEQIAQLQQARFDFNQRWSELSGNELSI